MTYKRSLKVTKGHNEDVTHLAEVGGGVDLVLVLLPVVKLDTLPACNSVDRVSQVNQSGNSIMNISTGNINQSGDNIIITNNQQVDRTHPLSGLTIFLQVEN